MPESKYGGFGDKTSGAFRTVGTIAGGPSFPTYANCRNCGLMYEKLPFARGLGMATFDRAKEVRDRADAERRMPHFAFPHNRCTCDPTGDDEVREYRERRFRQALASIQPPSPPAMPRPAPQSRSTPRRSTFLGRMIDQLLGRSGLSSPPSGVERSIHLAQLDNLFQVGALTREQYDEARAKLFSN